MGLDQPNPSQLDVDVTEPLLDVLLERGPCVEGLSPLRELVGLGIFDGAAYVPEAHDSRYLVGRHVCLTPYWGPEADNPVAFGGFRYSFEQFNSVKVIDKGPAEKLQAREKLEDRPKRDRTRSPALGF